MQNEFDNFSSDNQVEPSQPAPSGGGGSRLSSPIGNINKRPSRGKGGGTPGGNGGSPSSPPTTPSGKGAPGGGLPAKKSGAMNGLGSKLPGGGKGAPGGKGVPSAPISGKHGGQKDALKSDDKAIKREGQKELAKNVQHAKGGSAGKIAEANKQGGAKAAAGEVVRQGAKQGLEKGLQYAADAFTAGGAEAARPIIKGVGKTFEWLSRDKRWLKLIVATTIPIFVVLFLLFYAVMHPLDFIKKIGWTAFTSFASIAGKAITGAGYSTPSAIDNLNEKADHLATNNITDLNPSPGTMAYKLLNIDANKIQNSSTPNNGIPFKIKTVQKNGPGGKTYNILDSVVNTQDGTEYKLSCVVDSNCPQSSETIRDAVSAILTKSIPILPMLVRSPQTRKVNKAGDLKLALNYAEKKDNKSFISKSYDEMKDFFNKKTTKRVRGNNIDLPPISAYGSKEYKAVADSLSSAIADVQKTVSDGGDPNDLTIDPPGDYSAESFGSDTQGYSPKRISNVLCAFNAILLDPTNVSASIESRANAARRDGAKFMTMADTDNKGDVSNQEMRFTGYQMANFSQSMSYARQVNGQLTGYSIDPEGSSQTALTIDRGNSILSSMKNACAKYLEIEAARQDGSPVDAYKIDDIYRNEVRNAKVTMNDLRVTNPDDWNVCMHSSSVLNPNGPMCADYILRIAIMRNYFQPIQQAIYDDSNNYYKSASNVTPMDIIQRLVRIGGGASVTGRELGAQNFNRFNQGLQQLNYDWMQSYGGRFLTDTEQNTLALNQAKVRDWQNKNYGIAWRLFNTDNVSSVASRVMQNIPPDPSQAIGAILNSVLDCILNPIKTIASLDGLTTYIISGQSNIASAANTSVYDDAKFFKLSPVGFTDKELTIDWANNAKLIETLKANDTEVVDPDPLANGAKIPASQLFSKWDKCFTSKITSSYYLSNEYLLSLKNLSNLLSDDNNPYTKGFASDDLPKVRDRVSQLQAKYTLYMGCKPLLSAEANDINSLPVQYRVYHLRSTILDSLDSLSTDAPDDSIYASSGATAGGSGDSSGQVSAPTGPANTGPNTSIKSDPATHCTGGPQVGLVHLSEYMMNRWHTGNSGIYNCRNVRGGSSFSLHAEGRAFDNTVSASTQKALGDEIFNWAIANAANLGAQEIIWNRQIWSPSKGLHPYTGVNPHTDHVHIGLNWDGALEKTPFFTSGAGK